MIEEMGPVASIASLKFYENAALYGRPSSRQKCFFCDVCTKELILFLKDRQANGPGAEEMVG
jgi:hypothetical protein